MSCLSAPVRPLSAPCVRAPLIPPEAAAQQAAPL
jgi:hypothetical protein